MSESVTIASDTLEELDRKKHSYIRHSVNGITTKFYVKKVFEETFIYVTINAKQLQHRYLDGINRANVKFVYDYVMSLNRFYIDYSDFLDAGFHDCDIKTDFISNENQWVNNLYFRYKYYRLSKLHKFQASPGLEYSTRQNATNSTPHITLYSKYWELIDKSREFYDNYLYGWNEPNYRRFEVNIRNTAHWKYLSNQTYRNAKLFLNYPTTLRELLNLTQEELAGISNFLLELYESDYLKVKQRRKAGNKLSSTDVILSELLNVYVSYGHDIELLLKSLDFYFDSNSLANTKSRMRKRIKILLENGTYKPPILEEHLTAYNDIKSLFT